MYSMIYVTKMAWKTQKLKKRNGLRISIGGPVRLYFQRSFTYVHTSKFVTLKLFAAAMRDISQLYNVDECTQLS